MKKRLSELLVVICVFSLGLSITALIMSIDTKKDEKEVVEQTVTEEQKAGEEQFVIYLGTNDKDTNKPVFTPEEAKEKAREVLLEDFDGFTILEADGVWKDSSKIFQEYTVVICFSDTNIDNIHKAADKLIKVFNQSSILIQTNTVKSEFYEGE
ncbi:Protein of unknown function [Eubacterium ruminantium]|nr:Protein of unknown function [Eubacterium ruminantium]